MEESQQICIELEEIEHRLADQETKEDQLFTDPTTKNTVLNLIVAERLHPAGHKKITELSAEVAKIANTFRPEKDALRAKQKEGVKRLESLTSVAIAEGIERFNFEFLTLKFKQEIISQRYDIFKRTTMLDIMTNENSLHEKKKVIQSAIDRIRQMSRQPISQIRTFIEETMEKIGEIDTTRMEPKTVSEDDFYRHKSLLRVDPPGIGGHTTW